MGKGHLPPLAPVSAGAWTLQTASGLVVATQEQGVYVSRTPKSWGPLAQSTRRRESPKMSLTGTASQGPDLRTVLTPSHTHPCSDTQQFAQALVSLFTLFVLVSFYPPHVFCALGSVRILPWPRGCHQRCPLNLWEQLQDQRNPFLPTNLSFGKSLQDVRFKSKILLYFCFPHPTLFLLTPPPT